MMKLSLCSPSSPLLLLLLATILGCLSSSQLFIIHYVEAVGACGERRCSFTCGNQGCGDCPPGMFCPAAFLSVATRCPRGTSTNGKNRQLSMDDCEACDLGSYAPNEGTGTCLLCTDTESYRARAGAQTGAQSFDEACEYFTTTTTTTSTTSSSTTTTSSSTTSTTTMTSTTTTEKPTTSSTTTITEEPTTTTVTSEEGATTTTPLTAPVTTTTSTATPSSSSAPVAPPPLTPSTTTSTPAPMTTTSATEPEQATSTSIPTTPPTTASITTTTALPNATTNETEAPAVVATAWPTRPPLSNQQVATRSLNSGGAAMAALSGNIPTAQHAFKTLALSKLSQCGQPTFILEQNPLEFDSDPFGIPIAVNGEDDPLATYRSALVFNLIPLFGVLLIAGLVVIYLINTTRPLTQKERDELIQRKQLEEQEAHSASSPTIVSSGNHNHNNNNNSNKSRGNNNKNKKRSQNTATAAAPAVKLIELTEAESHKPVSVEEALRKVRFPSITIPIGVVLFGPPTIQAASAMLIAASDEKYQRSGLDIAMTFPAIACFVVYPLVSGVYAWYRSGSNKERLVTLQHGTSNNDDDSNSNSNNNNATDDYLDARTYEDEEARQADDECCNPAISNTVLVQWFYRWLRPEKEWMRTDFVLRHGLAFEPFTKVWFFVFDYVVAGLIAGLGGAAMACTTKTCCVGVTATSLVCAGTHTVLMFTLRPLVTKLDRLMNMALAVCPTTIASLSLYVVVQGEPEPTIDEAIAIITIVELTICVIDALLTFTPVVVDSYNWARRVFCPSLRQEALQEKRQQQRQQRQLEHEQQQQRLSRSSNNNNNKRGRRHVEIEDEGDDGNAAVPMMNLRDLGHQEQHVEIEETLLSSPLRQQQRTKEDGRSSGTNTKSNSKKNSKNNSSTNSNAGGATATAAGLLPHYVDLVVSPTLKYSGADDLHKSLPLTPPAPPPRLSKDVLSKHLKLERRWERKAFENNSSPLASNNNTNNNNNNNTDDTAALLSPPPKRKTKTVVVVKKKKVVMRKNNNNGKSFFDLEPVASPEMVFGGQKQAAQDDDGDQNEICDIDEDELFALDALDVENL